ncbi:MAG: hypothetical protein ACR2MB_00765, partial [Acidimicrobiales bacterium]
LPLTPGGLGVVETALPGTLIGFGVPGSIATISVLSWRFFQYVLPIPLGGVAYASLRLGTVGRAQRELDRVEAKRQLGLDLDLKRHVWDEETGQYRAIGVAAGSDAEGGDAPQPPG